MVKTTNLVTSLTVGLTLSLSGFSQAALAQFKISSGGEYPLKELVVFTSYEFSSSPTGLSLVPAKRLYVEQPHYFYGEYARCLFGSGEINGENNFFPSDWTECDGFEFNGGVAQYNAGIAGRIDPTGNDSKNIYYIHGFPYVLGPLSSTERKEIQSDYIAGKLPVLNGSAISSSIQKESSQDILKSALSSMLDKNKFLRVIAGGGSPESTVTTSFFPASKFAYNNFSIALRPGVVGVPNMAYTLGYSHFNWINEITEGWGLADPNISYTVLQGNDKSAMTPVLKDGVIPPDAKPVYDAGKKFQSICTIPDITKIGNQDCVLKEYDIYPWYENIGDIGVKVDQNDALGFFDMPRLNIKVSSPIKFKTQLYGITQEDINKGRLGTPIPNSVFEWQSDLHCRVDPLVSIISGSIACSGKASTLASDSTDSFSPQEGEIWTGGVKLISINGVPVVDDGDAPIPEPAPKSTPEKSPVFGLLVLVAIGLFKKLK